MREGNVFTGVCLFTGEGTPGPTQVLSREGVPPGPVQVLSGGGGTSDKNRDYHLPHGQDQGLICYSMGGTPLAVTQNDFLK